MDYFDGEPRRDRWGCLPILLLSLLSWASIIGVVLLVWRRLAGA